MAPTPVEIFPGLTNQPRRRDLRLWRSTAADAGGQRVGEASEDAGTAPDPARAAGGIGRRTDRLFVGLLLAQGAVAVGLATAARTPCGFGLAAADVLLALAVIRLNREVRAAARREAALEAARAGVEAEVRDRTREVAESGARFRTLLEHSTDFISVIDADGTILYESPSVEQLGYFPEDLVGRAVWALVHPDDVPAGKERLRRAVDSPGAIVPLELRFKGAGGDWRVREGSCRYVPGLFGAGAAVVNTRDVTDRRRAETRARLQHAATKILAEAPTARDAVVGVVEAACRAGGWEVGEFWEPAPDRPALVRAGGWHAPSAAGFEEAGRGLEFAPGVGLPGRVWATKAPHAVPDLAADPNFVRAAAAARAGLRSSVAFPILIGGRVVGVFDFLTRRADPPAPDEMELLEGLGGQMAQCLVRKRAEAARRESEERFQAFINNSPVVAFLKDEAGRYTYVNDPLVRRFGKPAEFWLGRTDEELFPDEYSAAWRENDRAVLAGGRVVEFSESVPLGDGGVSHWTTYKFPFRDAAGRLYLAGIGLDVTEKRRTADALRESEEKFRSVVEDLAEGMLLLDPDTLAVLEANPAAARLFGHPPGGLVGTTLYDLCAHDRASVDANRDRVARSGRLAVPRRKYRHRDGSLLDLDLSVSVVRHGGRPMHAVVFRDVGEQVRAEAALRESEERFRGAIEHAAIGMALVAPDGRFLRVNRALCAIVGYSDQELLTRTFQNLTHPDDLQADLDQVRRMLAGEIVTYQMEKRYVHKAGHVVWALLSVSLVRSAAGAPVHFVSQIQDITDRKAAEAELRERGQRFRAIFDATFQYIGLLSPDGTLLEANRTALNAPGVTADQVIGKPFWDCVWWSHNPDLQARLRGAVREAAAGRFARFEAVHPLATGEVAVIDFSVTPVRDESGAVVLLVPEGRDITYVKRAEAELRRTRAQLADAIECLDAGFVMYDADDRLVTCNGPFRDMYPALAPLLVPGTTYEQIARHGYRTGLYATDGRAEDEAVAARVAAHRAPGPPREILTGDRWLRVSTRRTGEGGFVSLRTDITDLKRAREEAEAATRARGEFLANMSHEIRTPMNGIMGLTDLVLETDLTAEQRESLSLVKSSAEALLTIINDILDFSKIEAGKLSLDPIPFRLRDAVGDTLKALALRAHGKGLELTCDVRPDVPDAVVGDAGRLRQVLTNLVGNAVKFTAKGEVGVRAERVPDPGGGVRVRFSVADTGIGIPADARAAIFDPFTQADGSTTRKYGGTGLGLTICARLVSLMGGTIAVESEPGKGSTFSFDVRFTRATPSAAKSGVFPPSDLRGLNVLVVDDNPTNRRVLAETLQLWGARAACAASGPEALAELTRAAAAGTPYPLVLLDAMMPEMDGFAVAERVAGRADLAAPVVMMLSSADRGEDAARCRALGMAGYLVKPVKPGELRRALAAAVGTRAEAARAARPAAPAPDAPPLRILLAEDNAVNQRVAVRILQGCGHRVTVANHGGEAVRLSAGERFDVILIDVQMPVMDGFEAVAVIRAREAGTGRRTPIVAMTAHAMKGDRERCLAAGMDDYLSKPVRRDELVGILARIGGEAAAVTPPPGPVETPPPAGPPAFDRAAALTRLGGDEALLAELAGLFREEAPRMLAEIRDALSAGDAAGVRRTAHGLKGSAGYVGAPRTVEAARRLELLGESGDLAAAPDALGTLEAEVEQLTAALATVAGPSEPEA
ncbi:MAG: hypothetical protein C0501_02275 [Isosphaera sp.]|nr:hypothetical protein [Isosphaera sp.]